MKKKLAFTIFLLLFNGLILAGNQKIKKIKKIKDLFATSDNFQSLKIDKKIKAPDQAEWADNFSAQQKVFSADEPIDFQIRIRNEGETTIKDITVTDYFPAELQFVFGPGTYDSSERLLFWTLEELQPGEEQKFQIRAAVASADKLSPQKTSVTNRTLAEAKSGQEDEDTTQFWVTRGTSVSPQEKQEEKKPEPEQLSEEQQLPETGNPFFSVTLLALAVASLGIFARKLGRGEIF